MKIRRLMFITIASVVLIGLSLTVSFADNMVQSAMLEPVPELEIGDTVNFKQYWVCETNSASYSSTPYLLVEYIGVNIPLKGRYNKVNNPLFCANPKYRDRAEVGIALCDQTDEYAAAITVNIYDLVTGNLLNSNNPAIWAGLSTDGYYGLYYNSSQPLSTYVVRGYRLGDLGYLMSTDESYRTFNSTPFVQWSTNIPDQIQLKSPLSEPVADKYNSYAVLDDRLIWISYRINGIYTRSASIENISEVYSYNAQITESGTGTYAGQQNGYTENIVIPSQNYSGIISGETEDISLADSSSYGGNYVGSDLGHSDPHYYQGAWYFVNEDLGNISFTGNHSGVISGTSLGNVDFSGVNTGNVHFNSDGTVSLKDIEYYPVSFNHNDIFEYYRLYCMPTDTDNFVFWLAPDRSFVPIANTNQLLVNMDFYYSEFDLEGNYIRSTFHTVTETDIGLFDAYQTEEPIHAVKFYGIDFFNYDNLPFNLSSVLWQYDFEFKTWRDNMLSKLNDIYNLLANAQNMPEPGSYDQWGNELNEYESNYSNMSPEQVNIVLKNALGNGRYDNAASQIKAWINNFSIGELIAVCVFALALGTVTLTLGKKKSD